MPMASAPEEHALEVGSNDACAVVGCVREKHLVDVAVAQEECEPVFQLEAIVETAADREETAGRFEIFDASFDACGQAGIGKEPDK